MDYKTKTQDTYDRYPEKFDGYFGDYFTNYLIPLADRFQSTLTGKKILDLGSGPGNHAAYFRDKGLDVHCVDISPAMIRLCKEKNLSAEVMDIENLALPEKSFDGIWANASLLHIPREKIPPIIPNLASLLKPQGILLVAMKEGTKEGFETNDKYPGTERWFTHVTKEEINNWFAPHFETVYYDAQNVKNKFVFLHYIFRLKG